MSVEATDGDVALVEGVCDVANGDSEEETAKDDGPRSEDVGEGTERGRALVEEEVARPLGDGDSVERADAGRDEDGACGETGGVNRDEDEACRDDEVEAIAETEVRCDSEGEETRPKLVEACATSVGEIAVDGDDGDNEVEVDDAWGEAHVDDAEDDIVTELDIAGTGEADKVVKIPRETGRV